jgi:hypothetical protein
MMSVSQESLYDLEAFLIAPRAVEPRALPRRYAEDDGEVTRSLAAALEGDEWWVALSQQERRTLTTDRLSSALWSGEVKNDAWVWREGMASWAPVTEVPQFALIAALPPAPTPPPERLDCDELGREDGTALAVKRVVMALSATAIVALFTTMYAISSGVGAGWLR